MTDEVCYDGDDVLNLIRSIPEEERVAHRKFVLRHIDFIVELLAGEQYTRHWPTPVGCSDSLAVVTAHRRKNGGVFPCVYERIETRERSLGDGKEDRTTATIECDARETAPCPCDDPLAESTNPLDAIAAVVLSSNDTDVVDRYFDHRWRTIADWIRDYFGSWEAVAANSTESVYTAGKRTNEFAKPVARHRLSRLLEALEYFEGHRYIDGLDFSSISTVSYENLHDMLTNAPGIDTNDGWWLMLTALDKPVWPSHPKIDRLASQLGLLNPEAVTNEISCRQEIVDKLTDRQVRDLHRTLAAHAEYGGVQPCSEDCAVKKFLLTHRQKKQQQSFGPTAVDLFAGAGGISHGIKDTFEIELAVDKDEDAADTYRLNHPSVPHDSVYTGDIGDLLDEKRLDELAGNVDLVVGGPPCQAFSRAGLATSRSDDDEYSVLDDPRAELSQRYIEALDRLQPAAILMENVKGILHSPDGTDKRIVDRVTEELNKIGYYCDFQVVNCADYGIPQTRERILILGVHSDYAGSSTETEAILSRLERATTPDKTVDLSEALSNLPRLRRGGGADITVVSNPGRTSEYVRQNGLNDEIAILPNHWTRQHPREKDRELFEEVMEPGDTGWSVKYEKNRPDLIDYPVGTEENPEFKDKYRMLDWSEPAPTIMAHMEKDTNDFILPDYYQYVQEDPEKADKRRSRGLTPREAARIQSFPDNYIFLGSVTSQFRQIGNAVPPLLINTVANILADWLSLAHSVTSTSADRSTTAADDD